MSTELVSLQSLETPWMSHEDSIVFGKDILEILTSAMYVDPLAIYREYVQNAADAIDEARRRGVLGREEPGTVRIEIDSEKRTVKIRDNGIGIPQAEFAARMLSIGASAKRGTGARGFRGVGRLSGLAYCHELLFRSRFAGESKVSEIRWDCRKAKELLRSGEFSGDLADVISHSSQFRRVHTNEGPDHFFEVELRVVLRHRNDWLLNSGILDEYLSQVAPVPFATKFRFAEEINDMIQEHVGLANITLTVCDINGPTLRPHSDTFEAFGGTDNFEELERIRIPALNGGLAAVGWIVHHGYKGAIPKSNLRGLRFRSGNIQVGDNSLAQDLFAESRFNSWSVGEIHVIDPRIIPNGRRDHYEQNVHYSNLINHLSPVAREISARCRQSSLRRNNLRLFERQQDQVRRDLAIAKQGSLGKLDRRVLTEQIQRAIVSMEKILSREVLRVDAPHLKPVIVTLRREFARLGALNYRAKGLATLSPVQRRAYEQVFAVLYECSPDKGRTKLLIDQVLARLSRTEKRKTSTPSRNSHSK